MKALTNYDKYMLAKQQPEATNENNTQDLCSCGDEYGDYLLNELRRTTPSANRVLNETEFYNMKNGEGAVAAVAKEEKETTPAKFRIKKKGKIFLTVYVILMLALASILIVSNTATKKASFEGISFNQSAGAAAEENSGDKSTVKAMTIEEEESGETNWFDKLCDSLNK